MTASQRQRLNDDGSFMMALPSNNVGFIAAASQWRLHGGGFMTAVVSGWAAASQRQQLHNSSGLTKTAASRQRQLQGTGPSGSGASPSASSPSSAEAGSRSGGRTGCRFLELGPFDVEPGLVRDMWLEMFRNMSFFDGGVRVWGGRGCMFWGEFKFRPQTRLVSFREFIFDDAHASLFVLLLNPSPLIGPSPFRHFRLRRIGAI